MKRIISILSAIFLTSCVGQKIICHEIKTSEVRALMFYSPSWKFNKCYGYCFNANKWETLPLNSCLGADLIPEGEVLQGVSPIDKKTAAEVIEYPLEYCDSIGGFKLDDLAKEVRPKIKKLNILKEDNCSVK